MRTIKRIVVHCTDAVSSQRAVDVVNYHLHCLGWSAPGYHYVIESDGKVVPTWPIEKVANGVRGYNQNSIHVCYTGGRTSYGVNMDTRTSEQRKSLRVLLEQLHAKFPQASIVGHNDLAAKLCPCFDAKREYADLQPQSKCV